MDPLFNLGIALALGLLIGRAHGILLTGLLGGLVSTATTFTFARLARNFLPGLVLAVGGVFLLI